MPKPLVRRWCEEGAISLQDQIPDFVEARCSGAPAYRTSGDRRLLLSSSRTPPPLSAQFDPKLQQGLPMVSVGEALRRYRDNGFEGHEGTEALLDSYDAPYRSIEEFLTMSTSPATSHLPAPPLTPPLPSPGPTRPPGTVPSRATVSRGATPPSSPPASTPTPTSGKGFHVRPCPHHAPQTHTPPASRRAV